MQSMTLATEDQHARAAVIEVEIGLFGLRLKVLSRPRLRLLVRAGPRWRGSWIASAGPRGLRGTFPHPSLRAGAVSECFGGGTAPGLSGRNAWGGSARAVQGYDQGWDLRCDND